MVIANVVRRLHPRQALDDVALVGAARRSARGADDNGDGEEDIDDRGDLKGREGGICQHAVERLRHIWAARSPCRTPWGREWMGFDCE